MNFVGNKNEIQLIGKTDKKPAAAKTDENEKQTEHTYGRKLHF